MKLERLVGAVALVLTACGSSADSNLGTTGSAGTNGAAGTNGLPSTVRFEDHADVELAAHCDYGVRCGQYPSRAACEASYLPMIRQRIYDVTKGITTFNGAAFVACMRGRAERACTVTALNAPRPQSCLDAFEGSQPGGGNCNVNWECASGLCFVDSSCIARGTQCCQGTCGDGVVAAIGGACLNDRNCAPDAACTPTSTGDFVCAPRVAAGQPCNYDECVTGLFCLPAGGGGSTCQPLPKRGEPCGEANPCDDLLADRCDPTTHLCVPAAQVGEACNGADSCVGYAACNSAKTCSAKSAPGGVCATTADCLGNATCSASLCKVAVDPIPCTLLR